MNFVKRFTKLMKSEPPVHKNKANGFSWVIDESKCLGLAEVRRLRNYCDKAKSRGFKEGKFSQIRNWFMVEIGLEAGLRVEEMASLKHSNLLVDREWSSIFVVGKGNKERSVWINSIFKKKCEKYINHKKRFGYSIDEDSFLLNNLHGKKITKRALQKFFKKIIREAGLSEHYHIHNLRHTYATFLLKASNNNYKFVQNQLGHSSITTTQIYAGIIESEGKKALERLYK